MHIVKFAPFTNNMNKVLISALALTVVFASCGVSKDVASDKVETTGKNMDLKTELDSVSYAIGINIGNNLKSQGVSELNGDVLSKAINDVFQENDLAISQEECNATVQNYLQKVQAAKYDAVKSEGENFLAENAKREGVTTLASGLQYEIMKEGTGAKPGPTSTVKTHYHGTTVDGNVFDSSVDRGQPASFPVNRVISGWTEALQLMPVGSKWKLFIPYDLAYGERGAGANIPPFSALIFEVELLEIEE